MYFNYTLEQVLNGTQTQTTRRMDSDLVFDPIRRVILTHKGHPLTYVGKTEPIETLRGRETLSVGTLRLLNIRQMPLRHITEEDAHAEGCRDVNDFAALWLLSHGTYSPNTTVLVYQFQVLEVYHERLSPQWERIA